MNQPDVHTFRIPAGTVHAAASTFVAAPPEQAASVYRAVDRWGAIFPATIASARIVRAGDGWKDILVSHTQEGLVPNTLFDLSETEIGLEEHKKKFDAWFTNRFLPATNGGTQYSIGGYIRLKGLYRLLTPLLKDYVRRQMIKSMRAYVLEPLKMAAEQERRGEYGPGSNRRQASDDKSSLNFSNPSPAGCGHSPGAESYAPDGKF